MVHVMATFRVKSDKLPEIRTAITEFVDAVKTKEPDCILYESFQGEDETSFVHLMSFESEEAEANHRQANHTREFTRVLAEGCEDGPIFARLTLFRSTQH